MSLAMWGTLSSVYIRRQRRAFDAAFRERLVELYAAVGPGFPGEVARVFAGDDATADATWCAGYGRRASLCIKADELSSGVLFALPPTWEVMRAVVRNQRGGFSKEGELVSVTGHLYCRPRGSWRSDRFPFLHVWTIRAGTAIRFESYFDGLALRRLEPSELRSAA